MTLGTDDNWNGLVDKVWAAENKKHLKAMVLVTIIVDKSYQVFLYSHYSKNKSKKNKTNTTSNGKLKKAKIINLDILSSRDEDNSSDEEDSDSDRDKLTSKEKKQLTVLKIKLQRCQLCGSGKLYKINKNNVMVLGYCTTFINQVNEEYRVTTKTLPKG
ncbi:hypothetical protein C8Q75DRAFT_731040 [Abortiporus biennis]|nr:hypothetical protein C8Q75DRAFT_731040 [Abortiporus biennis]